MIENIISNKKTLVVSSKFHFRDYLVFLMDNSVFICLTFCSFYFVLGKLLDVCTSYTLGQKLWYSFDDTVMY